MASHASLVMVSTEGLPVRRTTRSGASFWTAEMAGPSGSSGARSVAWSQRFRSDFRTSRSRSSKSKDYEGEVFESVADFVKPPDLLILRVGTLTNKNKAAPGILEGALRNRMDSDSPLWVVSDPDRSFGRNSFSYSDETAELISGYLKVVRIPRILTGRAVDPSLFGDPVSDQQATPEARPASSEGRPGRKVLSSDPEDGAPDIGDPVLARVGQGLRPKKKTYRREEG